MQQINTLNILQHNVLSWNKHRFGLINTYNTIDPHVILLNAHACKNDYKIKIFNYSIIQNNPTNEIHDGSVIAIRKDISQIGIQSSELYSTYGAKDVPSRRKTRFLFNRWVIYLF